MEKFPSASLKPTNHSKKVLFNSNLLLFLSTKLKLDNRVLSSLSLITLSLLTLNNIK